LSAVGRLGLLRVLYVRVLVPRTVFDEVVVVGQGEMGSGEVAAATWIEVREVADRDGLLAKFETRIDAGEAAAIVLALNVRADLIVMDDRLGRREAEAEGLVVHGTLGVLLRGACRRRRGPAGAARGCAARWAAPRERGRHRSTWRPGSRPRRRAACRARRAVADARRAASLLAHPLD